MSRKFTALAVVVVFLMSTVAVAIPVDAHFTLGNLTGTYRFHANDFDPHVPGVIGYVWPGGGQNAFGGIPNYANTNNAPGYQSPYPGQKPSNVPGVNQFGNAPSSSWYQLEGDTYAPFGAVLTGSTGDLIFAINATYGTTGRWTEMGILIPPGFGVPDVPQIVTTITNDYSGISVIRVSPYDRYAPGWTLVQIISDAGLNAAGALSTPYYNHQAIDFTSAGEWYYVRINGVLAPSVAGRYFFKILLYTGTRSICGEEGIGSGTGGLALPNGLGPELCSQFIPTQNWPVLLVKGEIDPAIITGTIRYAGYNQTLYSKPIQEAGRVDAVMTTRLDPYTGQQRSDLPTVDAVGYFNATAQGHYEVEGLAPGVYDLYASAAGYPKTLVQSGFTVLKGQSLHFDGYLQPGPVIHGNVFTKHQFGDEPWPLGDTGIVCPAGSTDCTPGADITGQYMKIELYDAPTLNHVPDPGANMVSWSPLPCIAGGQEFYTGLYDAGSCNDARLGAKVAFPWHEYVPWNGYGVPSSTPPGPTTFYQVAAGGAVLGTGVDFSRMNQDPQGVGPPQHWYVQGGTTTPFHFEFGVKGEYGAPRDLDGMVPQVYATWVNGLTPGRYYVRAWTFRYVQSALDGSTFQEYYFDVTPNEWAGDVTLPIDLRLSSWVNKTVHFHNVINGITEDPIDTGAGMMSGVLVDANGRVWSYNQTELGYKGQYTCGSKTGSGIETATNFAWNGPVTHCTEFQRGNHLDQALLNKNAIETGRANIQFWGWNDTWGGENYGIPSGTYSPHVFVLGYLEESAAEQVSVTLSGNPTSISDHVFRSTGLNLTMYSIDWERPRVSRNWVWGQWGYGLSWPTTVNGALGTCPNFPINGNPAAPDSYCSGQQPYPWGAGYTTSPGQRGTAPPTPSGLGPVPPYTPITAACPGEPTCMPMVGQEIDVGVYQNGTLRDFIGDEPTILADTAMTSCLFQNDTASFVQLCGGGWNPQYLDPASQKYIPYEGNSNDAYFGQELDRPGQVGGYIGGEMYFTTSALLFGPAHYSPTTLPNGGVYNSAVSGYTNLYPSSLPQGQYDLRGFTYGYIQDKSFSVYAYPSQVADIKLNLIIGVNVTLDILFKKEHIITPTDGNMSARVRLFDDSGNLVAEWMSSEGTYITGNGFARAADGTTQYQFGPSHPSTPFPLPLNSYNYLPGGVTELHVLMAGLPQVPPGGTDGGVIAPYDPQQIYFNDPILSTTTCGFQINCYTSPGTALGVGVPGFFPNTGILGAPDYQGGWTAEVDFVRWYANSTGNDCFEGIGAGTTTCTPNTVPNVEVYTQGALPVNPSYVAGTPTVTITTGTPMAAFTTVHQQTPNYYAPVAGLLMGESYHIIPGTTATSGISLTEDTALKPEFLGHTISANHIGPYSQEGVWQISNAHNSGEASGIFEVDLNGLVTGNAFAFTWSNEFRPLSWGLVNVTGASGMAGSPMNFYTFDGQYQAYLPPGNYQFTISSPGIASQTYSVAVSSGQTGSGYNMYLEQSNIPVPEFSGLVIAAISALAASLYVLRRRHK